MKRGVQLSITNERIAEFIAKMNEAFFARSNDKMPVSELGIDDLKDQQELYALFDDDELVAGLAFCLNRMGFISNTFGATLINKVADMPLT